MGYDPVRIQRSLPGDMDYKTVLGVACTVIVLLVGFSWGIWNANHESESLENQRINQLQWEHIRSLNDTLIEVRTRQANIRRETDDQEGRIRALEHRGERR